jgi:CheY-like chemotaxis protein
MSANDAPWRGKSALIVDDYAAVRKTIREIFAGLGLVVDEAENGLAAMEALKGKPYDLVVSDLVMPEMDGFELTEAMKNAPELRRIPLVIISTHDDAKYTFRALHLGADDYLIKPPSVDMVKTVLARMFDYAW